MVGWTMAMSDLEAVSDRVADVLFGLSNRRFEIEAESQVGADGRREGAARSMSCAGLPARGGEPADELGCGPGSAPKEVVRSVGFVEVPPLMSTDVGPSSRILAAASERVSGPEIEVEDRSSASWRFGVTTVASGSSRVLTAATASSRSNE